jgi:hypothetical protein
MESTNNDQSLLPTTPCFFAVDKQIKSTYYNVTKIVHNISYGVFVDDLCSRA